MCRVLFTLTVLVLSAVTHLHAQDTSMALVTRLERDLLEAAARKDAAALHRLLADDIVATGPTGKMLGKSDLIARWTKTDPGVTDEASAFERLSVRDFGDTVVVHARIIDMVRDAGVTRRYVTQVTDTWVKRRAGWQVVAMHESLVPEQAQH